MEHGSGIRIIFMAGSCTEFIWFIRMDTSRLVYRCTATSATRLHARSATSFVRSTRAFRLIRKIGTASRSLRDAISTFSCLGLSADFDIELYAGSSTSSRRIATSVTSGTSNERIRTTTPLAAGTYFLRVVPRSVLAATRYTIYFNCSGRIAP